MGTPESCPGLKELARNANNIEELWVIFSKNKKIDQDDFQKRLTEQLDFDSLDFIELNMTVEECETCSLGTGSGSCTLGSLVIGLMEDSQ